MPRRKSLPQMLPRQAQVRNFKPSQIRRAELPEKYMRPRMRPARGGTRRRYL